MFHLRKIAAATTFQKYFVNNISIFVCGLCNAYEEEKFFIYFWLLVMVDRSWNILEALWFF